MDYRHEIKHMISAGDAAGIRANLSAVARLDPHAREKGYYRIRSLYFDDPADTGKPETAAGTERPEAPDGADDRQNPPGGFPGGDFAGFDGNGGYSSGQWIWTAICAAVILAAILVIRKAGDHNQ